MIIWAYIIFNLGGATQSSELTNRQWHQFDGIFEVVRNFFLVNCLHKNDFIYLLSSELSQYFTYFLVPWKNSLFSFVKDPYFLNGLSLVQT